jgi:hypothetical protein
MRVEKTHYAWNYVSEPLLDKETKEKRKERPRPQVLSLRKKGAELECRD